ncbi:hypothetical protein [Salipaludibacillus sp. CF4.18]|uniref:hypothetical protein n=1 Tax=Salipaludibacillus sp. CF4.18 TaxID=3373081 RepID=UPI003EE67D3A
MLKVKLYYKENRNSEGAFQKAGFSKAREGYFLDKALSKKRESVLAEHKADSSFYQLIFSGDLTFEDYQIIHDAVKILATELEAEIDDDQAFMGYLENGEKACLYYHWKKWKAYLLKAKHRSMEGQKIEVTKGTDKWQGILLGYTDKTVNDEFFVTECTILGTSGEIRVQGEDLHLTPTGDFL